MKDLARQTLRSNNLIRLVTRFHQALYRLTGGFVGGLIAGVPNLLLTTVGRKSGKKFTTPLFYLPDGASFVVVASYGGNPQDPQWWKNLQADPRGWVQVGPRSWEVSAEKGSEELKARLWPVFCRYYPEYLSYQARTERVIPLVVLRPAWAPS